MIRADVPGTQSVRAQLGIAPEDPRVYRPVELTEALDAARLIARDSTLDQRARSIAEVGITLDLMPGHRTPKKSTLAAVMSLSSKTVRRREIAWEMGDQVARFDAVARAVRVVFAARGAEVAR